MGAVLCAGDPRLSNYVPVIARCLPEKQTFSDQTLPATRAYPHALRSRENHLYRPLPQGRRLAGAEQEALGPPAGGVCDKGASPSPQY